MAKGRGCALDDADELGSFRKSRFGASATNRPTFAKRSQLKDVNVKNKYENVQTGRRCLRMMEYQNPLEAASPREIAEAICEIYFREWPRAEEEHLRKARLRAYRNRHRWRKADIPRLLKLGVNIAAQRRMARILESKSSGRGVVGEYISLFDTLCFWERQFQEFGTASMHPNSRLAFIKTTPWWPNFVEAMYRAKLAALQEDRHHQIQEYGRGKRSEHAEQAVADIVGLSSATVHAICQKVREKQKHGAPKDPALSISEFQRVLETGSDFKVIRTL
jgi:hypothetical protein